LWGFVNPSLGDCFAIKLEEAVVNVVDHVLGLVLGAHGSAIKFRTSVIPLEQDSVPLTFGQNRRIRDTLSVTVLVAHGHQLLEQLWPPSIN
jgi:hypothetical protein